MGRCVNCGKRTNNAWQIDDEDVAFICVDCELAFRRTLAMSGSLTSYLRGLKSYSENAKE